jgi:protein-S-isoprenylcysteine O-methyltransferase Ste14
MFAVTFVVAGGSLVVIALVISFVFLRQRDRRLQARAIKRLGFGVSAVFSVLAGLFITGEAFEEPGGIGAVSLVLAWVIPLVLARLGPRSAQVSPRGSGGAVLGSQQQRGT